MHDIIRSLGPKLKHRPIQVVVDVDEQLEINSYPGVFAQIVTNFIINSLLHAFEETDEGVLTIQVRIEDNVFTMKYLDNGKGIPPENIDRIFEPFFTTHMQSGTGLGMHIAYNLVTQKLGGEINLESELGKGVCFTITVPSQNLV